MIRNMKIGDLVKVVKINDNERRGYTLEFNTSCRELIGSIGRITLIQTGGKYCSIDIPVKYGNAMFINDELIKLNPFQRLLHKITG